MPFQRRDCFRTTPRDRAEATDRGQPATRNSATIISTPKTRQHERRMRPWAALLLSALPTMASAALATVQCHNANSLICARHRHRLVIASAAPSSTSPDLPPVEDLSGDGGVLMRRAVGPAAAQDDGEYARPSTYARVHYRATLEGGVVLADSRSEAGEPLELRVGAQPSEGVPGWDLALPRMRVGDRAVLVCEPRYAFGEAGVAPHIPPMATVRFDLELLGVRDLLSSNNTEKVDFLEKYAHVMAANEINKITREAQEEAEAEAGAKADAFFAAEAKAVGDVIDAVAEPDVDADAAAGPGQGGAGRPPMPEPAAAAPAAAAPAAAAPAAPAPAAAGRGWVPSATRVEASHPAGHSWRETDGEIEVRVPLPLEAASAKDISVEIGTRSLRVVVLGEECAPLSGRLTGRLAVEESSWSYLPAGEEGDAPVLQLDLMKKVRASEHEPLWGYVLESERASASGQRVDAGGAGGDGTSGGDGSGGDAPPSARRRARPPVAALRLSAAGDMAESADEDAARIKRKQRRAAVFVGLGVFQLLSGALIGTLERLGLIEKPVGTSPVGTPPAATHGLPRCASCRHLRQHSARSLNLSRARSHSLIPHNFASRNAASRSTR